MNYSLKKYLGIDLWLTTDTLLESKSQILLTKVIAISVYMLRKMERLTAYHCLAKRNLMTFATKLLIFLLTLTIRFDRFSSNFHIITWFSHEN